MNVKRSALIVLSIVILTSLTINFAYAGNAASVSTAYVGINPTDHSGQVSLGATVYIYWTGVTPSQGTVDIKVINPNGTMLTQWTGLAPSASGTKSFVASSTGNYYVILEGYPSYHLFSLVVASASLFVLPESVLGTSITLIAGFSAVGFIGVVQRKHAKNKET